VSATVARWLATWGGLGDVFPAPGTTVGSLFGCAAFLVLAGAGAPLPPGALAALAAGLLLAPSVWACGAEARRRETRDPSAIVIDETVGQWLALAVVLTLRPGRTATLALVAVSFALFRAFDILKPWPVRAAERLPGGWGIVADDVLAGLLSGALHAALAGL
jgi:phosphatidylglycerophosphatase A